LPPSWPCQGRKQKKIKPFLAFDKRDDPKRWLSQKLRKAEVYSDKWNNQNVLFTVLHKN
jgi:hypothetical protein